MAQEAQITATQPYTYLDVNNQVVNGFRVYFVILKYSESHFVQVPNLNPDTVKAAINALVKQRNDLATI